ncbi:MAG: Ironsulfur cluster assembly ATPase protein SufC [Patescibacteria group bacterium]|jgi:Fe-S cluster assembly ATP-binding protein|nr:Ironsulfur cluster assembly ATPase protein SufC [Patescibacteria group bacterium]
MLEITDLHASIEDKKILSGLSLTIKKGEWAALMGPNGSGKSTLAHILAGHPSYEVQSGSILLEGQDVLAMAPEGRAANGIFLAFQYPASIPGVSVSQFLRLSLNAQQKARGEEVTGVAPFIKLLRTHMKTLEMPMSFAERAVGDGFSGGEKKRLEMLQMLVLQPKLVILDEIDSGLDIDAMKVVSDAVKELDKTRTSVLIITHYQRLLNYLTPDSVHVMKEGQIIKSGGAELALQLEAEGYSEI